MVYGGSTARIMDSTLDSNVSMGVYVIRSVGYFYGIAASNNSYGGVYISRGSTARIANGVMTGNGDYDILCYRGSFCEQSGNTATNVQYETYQAGSL